MKGDEGVGENFAPIRRIYETPKKDHDGHSIQS